MTIVAARSTGHGCSCGSSSVEEESLRHIFSKMHGVHARTTSEKELVMISWCGCIRPSVNVNRWICNRNDRSGNERSSPNVRATSPLTEACYITANRSMYRLSQDQKSECFRNPVMTFFSDRMMSFTQIRVPGSHSRWPFLLDLALSVSYIHSWIP